MCLAALRPGPPLTRNREPRPDSDREKQRVLVSRTGDWRAYARLSIQRERWQSKSALTFWDKHCYSGTRTYVSEGSDGVEDMVHWNAATAIAI